MNTLTGKVSIVTGGASGIGEAIARLLARRGAPVVIADVQNEAGAAVADQIRREGHTVEFRRCDVSRTQEVDALVAWTVERFGRLDAMVANAGVQVEKPLAETTDAEWDRVIDTNLKGTFLCCRAAVRQMLQNGGGNIIATGSVLSLVAEPALAAYCASKGGVLMLIRSIATDYGRRHIRANCVCPGYINTPLGDGYFAIQPDPAAARRAADAMHALGRMGEPDEVARCVAFLLSEEASFMTGSALVVDGGLIAKV
jgi:NAD(P)-dependent dehydrogenase (short-subunit alcohol dehydrogenase family)